MKLRSLSIIIILCLALGATWLYAQGSAVTFVDSGQDISLDPAGNSNNHVVLGDLNGDGTLDAVTVGDLAIARRYNFDGIFHTNFNWGYFDNLNHAALGDVDGDGQLDIFVVTRGPNKVLLNKNGFSPGSQDLGDLDSQCVALGDVDNDGDLDAFVGNAQYRQSGEEPTSAGNEVWLNQGNGTFVNSGQSLGDGDTDAVALGDLNDDGYLDAFVVNGGTRTPADKVWLNQKDGTFVDSEEDLGFYWGDDVALGDVDDDGDLDAVVSHYTFSGSAPSLWLNNGDGTFDASDQLVGMQYTRGVALGDVDRDNDLDVVFAQSVNLEAERANTIWLNQGNGQFVKNDQSLGDAFSNDVALGDLNGDLMPDIFAANSGVDKVWFNQTVAPPPNYEFDVYLPAMRRD